MIFSVFDKIPFIVRFILEPIKKTKMGSLKKYKIILQIEFHGDSEKKTPFVYQKTSIFISIFLFQSNTPL